MENRYDKYEFLCNKELREIKKELKQCGETNLSYENVVGMDLFLLINRFYKEG